MLATATHPPTTQASRLFTITSHRNHSHPCARSALWELIKVLISTATFCASSDIVIEYVLRMLSVHVGHSAYIILNSTNTHTHAYTYYALACTSSHALAWCTLARARAQTHSHPYPRAHIYAHALSSKHMFTHRQLITLKYGVVSYMQSTGPASHHWLMGGGNGQPSWH